MARMTSNHMALYPQLTNWVKNALPAVQKKKRVWDAFLNYSELGKNDAIDALSWGSDPLLFIKIIPGANGEFNPTLPRRIALARDIARRFEKDYALLEAHRLVESTVLHEIVHWGDHRDGHDQCGEEGIFFEIAAYGENVHRYWTEAMMSPREKAKNATRAARDNGCCAPPFKPKAYP